ncbi:uncharacterized protein LOC120185389 [Hibiscus syriacus]|uniref:uncharacterized protein LOC120185389 n=1 Tax=Hibiscus syriacus TaxID=106335 RepID=UPI0019210E81|nr:uncharacterized protein LOC120185389 [Hibiscus syriacus]
MASEVIAFYKNLIGSVDTNVEGCDYNFLKNILSYSLPPEHSSNLIKDVTTKEIKEAIFEQGNDKAPGLDGYTPLFFKKTWSIVGMVSLNQTTFIKGRSIVDNTLLAQDLVKGYGRKAISPRCSLKIDLQKAFDTLHWGFLSVVLKALDIPQRFIDWIEACFKQARFSISFNGSLIGYFNGARGIRQGEPLSPILFVLSMNILSSMLNMAAARGLFNYHPKCKKVGITHLSFVDDLLIFCKGNVESVIGVITVLESFYEMSGLNLNAAKYMFFTAGISLSHIEHIKQATGFTYGHLPVRYLGVPLITRKLSENDCESLIASIKARLTLWSGKNLSYAGRLELVRAVLFNIANYWCRQLPLPQAIISKIEQLCSRFFWKGSDKSATGARISWTKICQLKSEGGLGLKNLKDWNKACLIKLLKNLLAGEGSLWIAWNHAYVIKGRNLCQMENRASFNWSFNRILKLRSAATTPISIRASSIKDIWQDIRVKEIKVPWHSLIWFPQHIPKHSLIAWMAILDRLPTRDRLMRMGIIIEGNCVLSSLSLVRAIAFWRNQAWETRVRWIPRSDNCVADALTKLAPPRLANITFFDAAPRGISNLVLADARSPPHPPAAVN